MPAGLSKSLKIDPLWRIEDELSSDDDTGSASDLQLVCELPPVLETRASAQVVKAVGSAIHRPGFLELVVVTVGVHCKVATEY